MPGNAFHVCNRWGPNGVRKIDSLAGLDINSGVLPVLSPPSSNWPVEGMERNSSVPHSALACSSLDFPRERPAILNNSSVTKSPPSTDERPDSRASALMGSLCGLMGSFSGQGQVYSRAGVSSSSVPNSSGLALLTNLLLVFSFAPFAILGWSTHYLLPHEHGDACCHIGATASHTHDASDAHHHGNHHHGHSHDYQVHEIALDSAELGDTTCWRAGSDHDCELCKLLTQLRYRQVASSDLAAGTTLTSVSELSLQNATLAALSIYYLRGPPVEAL